MAKMCTVVVLSILQGVYLSNVDRFCQRDSITAVQDANTKLCRCVGIKIKTELEHECGTTHEY